MSPAGFEIDDEPVVQLVFGVVVAQAGGACLVPIEDMPFHFVYGVER
ncbi:MAG: hypothetical protein JO372_07105 [Solirubrobacterales bacterium]|nr:hypothetical protein [Solirubrobacterales bacterium]